MSTTIERRLNKLEAYRSDLNQIAIINCRVIGADVNEVDPAVIGKNVVDRHADEAETDFIKISKCIASKKRPQSRAFCLWCDRVTSSLGDAQRYRKDRWRIGFS